MKIQILNVGQFENLTEYILIKAKENLDLKNFAIIDTTFDDAGDVSNKQKHFYRFPAKIVLKNQIIALFTQRSGRSQGHIDSKNVMYFSWGLNHNIWNNGGDCATVIEIADHESKKV